MNDVRLPQFSAEAALYRKGAGYRLEPFGDVHKDIAVTPARFAILRDGHVGYCCNCNSNHSNCACEACMSF